MSLSTYVVLRYVLLISESQIVITQCSKNSKMSKFGDRLGMNLVCSKFAVQFLVEVGSGGS